MQILVQHQDGTSETLIVVLPLQAKEGKALDTLIDAAGVEHFFTKDGYYDGHGGMVFGLYGAEPKP